MTGLEGLQLYRAIEYPNERDSSSRVTLTTQDLIPLADPPADPRDDPEVARAIAA